MIYPNGKYVVRRIEFYKLLHKIGGLKNLDNINGWPVAYVLNAFENNFPIMWIAYILACRNIQEAITEHHKKVSGPRAKYIREVAR